MQKYTKSTRFRINTQLFSATKNRRRASGNKTRVGVEVDAGERFTSLLTNAPPLIPVIYGPTAGGKSDAAVALARRWSSPTALAPDNLAREPEACAILAADAFQVYRGMDIGTAKPLPDERALDDRSGISHELIDLVDAHDPRPFTVEDWLTRAHATIARCDAERVCPIIVGGTALYVQSLLFGMFQGPPADATLRAELGAMRASVLREELERVDPAAAARIHPNDTRRTIRAIEVFRLTGRTITSLQTQWTDSDSDSDADADDESNAAARPGPNPRFRLFVLTWPTESLNRRINARVKRMMERGLLDEVRALESASVGPLSAQAREALGYKQLLAHLADPRRVPLDEAVERIKIETRRFAKNQRTWMRRLSMTRGATTIDALTLTPEQIAQRIDEQINAPKAT